MLSARDKNKARKGDRKRRCGGAILSRGTVQDLTEQVLPEQHREEVRKKVLWW